MNMGNVMGNVTWLTKEFHSEGRLSIGSTGHENLFVSLGFGDSSLDTEGGIVGDARRFELEPVTNHIIQIDGNRPRTKATVELIAPALLTVKNETRFDQKNIISKTGVRSNAKHGFSNLPLDYYLGTLLTSNLTE